jgi:hypothetical protein
MNSALVGDGGLGGGGGRWGRDIPKGGGGGWKDSSGGAAGGGKVGTFHFSFAAKTTFDDASSTVHVTNLTPPPGSGGNLRRAYGPNTSS